MASLLVCGAETSFARSTDTSWYELSGRERLGDRDLGGEQLDRKATGGSLFARVFRDENLIAVSLLDLSGSEDGSWSSGTERGRCANADVEVLIASPEAWSVEVAVLGREYGRFASALYSKVTMREGRGIRISVPTDEGWSVLRLTPKKTS